MLAEQPNLRQDLGRVSGPRNLALEPGTRVAPTLMKLIGYPSNADGAGPAINPIERRPEHIFVGEDRCSSPESAERAEFRWCRSQRRPHTKASLGKKENISVFTPGFA
jgi:hypothetical protein